MKTNISIGITAIFAVLICISLSIFPVSGIVVSGESDLNKTEQAYSATISTEFDGTNYIIKNVDTDEILETLSPAEFEKKKTESNLKFRVEMNESGMMTIYDNESGKVVGTGIKKNSS
ncbi:hypothetical protein [Methanospirillum lacunae]|uniref:Uncharacterized protein n=1 Tax=Methanospirillum lacunae TaxID=668570 RepID=A0A2V2NBH5_9EURY|nr:hypothetical protein [Methanospirillum lacunae]PWR73697.1 hypothetical protein DK846_00555 [Methanospirillum lacunae]